MVVDREPRARRPAPRPRPRPASFLDTPGYTVLLAPVPAFEDFARTRLQRWAPDFLRRDGGLHAHVTILAPFLPAAELDAAALAALAEVAAAASGFTVTFRRVDRFGTGLVYAVPEPAEPFAALTAAAGARWPWLRPYAGEWAAVPHLSLDHGDPDALASELTWPRSARIDTLEVVRYLPGDTRRLAAVSLGG